MSADDRLTAALSVLARHGVVSPHAVRTTAAEHDLLVLAETEDGGAVLKQTPPGSTSAAMQAGLLRHVAQRDPLIPVPRLLEAADGSVVTEDEYGTAFVSTFLRGTPIEDIVIGSTIVDGLVDLQRRLHLALADADADRLQVPERNAWSIESLLDAESLIDRHAGDLAGFARAVVAEYRKNVVSVLATLPRHVLHADINLSNVLVTDGDVSGLIDFGDAVRAPRVLDIAVTAAYLALGLGDDEHPLVRRYLDGARRALDLGDAECALIPALVRARVVLVILLGRENASRDPSRAAYALRLDAHAERLVDAMTASGPMRDDTGSRGNRTPDTIAPLAGDYRMANRFDPAAADVLPEDDRALLARRRAVLGDIYPLFYDTPLHVVRGHGARLIDSHGAEYLDAYNNVPAVGHANPRVAEAVAVQLSRMNTHTRYLQDGIVEFAERFLDTYPAALDRVVFTNSGSEANDLALQVARWRTDAHGVIVTRRAYHGTTALLAGLSPENGSSMPLHPFVRTVEAPDTYLYGDAAGEILRESVADAIEDLERAGYGVSAILIDSILSTDGIFPGPPGMLRPAFDAVRAAGGLVIADEVQSGMGRLGEHLWGFERHTDDVDMVTCGKPMAGGLPIGSLVLTAELSNGYARDHRYFNTFGGNPASIAAASAVLSEIAGRDLVELASRTGGLLRRRIEEEGAADPLVADVRGAGLFVGVEMAGANGVSASDVAHRMVNGLRERRVLVSAVGASGQVLKVRPPLVFAADDVEEFAAHFGAVLRDVSSTLDGAERERVLR